MNLLRSRTRSCWVTLFILLSSLVSHAATTVETIRYHGWDGALKMSNGKIDVIVVPSIGRIMQARFAGEEDGPFWENRKLDGHPTDPKSNDWGNFGGDKTWPSPQNDWPKLTPRGWPPPTAFDSMPATAEVVDGVVKLKTSVDKDYGIEAEREIRLLPDQTAFTVKTSYRKVTGEMRHVGVWVITQLKDPSAVFLHSPEHSVFAHGYELQSDSAPLDLAITNRLISLRRGPKIPSKIGTDADSILWIGGKWSVLIESPRFAGMDYPDHQSSAEVYTNPDPTPYVELELLAPLHEMKPGDATSSLSTYHLFHRTERDTTAEAKKIFGL